MEQHENTTPEAEAPVEETETPEAEESTEAESTEAKSYGGIVPLSGVADLLSAEEWDDGGDDKLSAESVEALSTRLAKNAVLVVKATDSLANRFRAMCVALLTIRAGIIVTRQDGTVGPDWDARSDLAKRFTTMVITKPLYDAGLADRVEYVTKTISAYYSKKVPGQNYTLRDQFIREWVKAHAAETVNEETGETETLPPEAIENRVDAEFAAFESKSDRVKTNDNRARRANVGGPGQGAQPKNPTETLMGAANAVVASPADLSIVVLIEQAHKLESRIALQIRKNGGEVQDRPAVIEAWNRLQDLSAAITESLDDRRKSWEALESGLYGKEAREAWAGIVEAEHKEAEAAKEAEEAESTETETAEEAATV